MVNEVTMICMDTSSWMEHSRSHCFLGQIDAIQVYCEKYLQSHTENYVGVLAMGGKSSIQPFPNKYFLPYPTLIVVEPTRDLSLIMSGVRGFTRVGGDTLLVSPLRMGSSYLSEKYENHLKRLVVFAGGPIRDAHNQYTNLGTELKEKGVAVDVVNFGAQQAEYKKHQLLVLLDAVNNNDNTRMLDLCGHHLNGSSVTPLVLGQGERCLYQDYLFQGEYLRTAKNQCDKVHGVADFAICYLFRKLARDGDEQRKKYNKVNDGRKRYRDQGDRNDRERYYRGHDDGRKRYRDRGDRNDPETYYRGHDDGRKRYRDRGDRNDRETYYRGHDDGRKRYRDQGDRNDRETYYRGHDDGRKRYRDRGDRNDRERCYRCHDNERGRD